MQEQRIRVRVDESSGVIVSTAYGDEFIHVGAFFVRMTACGKSLKDAVLASEMDITCPDCIAEIRKRMQDPGARTPIGF